VPLTPTETRLLARLAQAPGRVVTRRELQEALWGGGGMESGNSLNSYVAALRRKIEVDPRRPRLLLTARRSGYRLL
jgi:two-component system KDP operon response regulator KdpE